MSAGRQREYCPYSNIRALHHTLPLVDSLTYATSRAREATLWTQDADFKGLPEVRYRPSRPPK